MDSLPEGTMQQMVAHLQKFLGRGCTVIAKDFGLDCVVLSSSWPSLVSSRKKKLCEHQSYAKQCILLALHTRHVH